MIKKIDNNITPVYIRLEMKGEDLSDSHKRMLKRYGKSYDGEMIARDVLIPSDMPLHNLHYAIQKLFGWTNSHLREFNLPDEVYNEITSKSVKGWSELVGTLFQSPSQWEKDIFWDDDYEHGSANVWLRKKYTGPYVYGGYYEHYENAREDINKLFESSGVVQVRESFDVYVKRTETDPDKKIKIIGTKKLIDMSMEEFLDSIALETSPKSLMESLEVAKVLASEKEPLKQEGIFPVTRELIYYYDFGDGWELKISKFEDCSRLLENNTISVEELHQAMDTVLSKHKPVCLNAEGLNLVEDVGNLNGYARLLYTIHESDDKEEVSSMKQWAKFQGWTGKTLVPKKIL